MQTDDYVRAFRFGFGLNAGRGEQFDPGAELKVQPPDAAPVLDELAGVLSREAREGAGLRELNTTDAPGYEIAVRQRIRRQTRFRVRQTHDAVVRAVATRQPFLRRIAAFWINHFSIGKVDPAVRSATMFFERAAIEPHMLGNFADLLVAAELFPAMVHYLNLQTSVGPNSKFGKQRGKGINENLGREILELHTLGVDGGYTQADVTALAMIMTGWMVNPKTGRTMFLRGGAEPGTKTLLDRRFGEHGTISQFHAALRMLARHPSTARHIGRKLAHHFIGPNHDAEAAKLAAVFMANGGELRPVYEALIEVADGKPFGLQMRNDFQFLVSALRAVDLRPGLLDLPAATDAIPQGALLTAGGLRSMTQIPWGAPTPEGWPDDPAFWLSPSVLSRRLQWLPKLIERMAGGDPDTVLANALGPLASANTAKVMGLASNRLEAIGLVFASPEFNRR